MYLINLSNKIWYTRTARFTASKRMRRSNVSSTAAVAILSASIIAVNMLEFFPGVVDKQQKLITIASIILSTFALVMSLLVTLLRYEWREYSYHKCAVELENLNQRLLIRIAELVPLGQSPGQIVSPSEDNKNFLKEYSEILKKYNQNHTDFDYQYSKKYDSNVALKKRTKICLFIRWYVFDVYSLYWFIAFAPVFLISYWFFKVLTQ